VLSRRLYRHQRGRRPLAAVAAAGLVVSILVVANTAVAVHDEGVFQLDGNATTQPGTSDPVNNQSNTTGIHDWDQVYADRNYTGNPPFPTSGAQSQAFVTDGFGAGDSILTGGGTKDINDIQANWLWKQTSTTSVQDKDDIEHAFAAQYKVDKSGATDACGTGSNGDPIKTANCVLLYFGADRFSNSGNTTMGFWFFKNEITPVGPDASGNGTFTGVHTARSSSGHGDILIVTDFLTGGQAPTATVYEWVASGGNTTTHLDKIGGGTVTAADCTEGAPSGGGKSPTPVPPVSNNDNLCATVNANVVSVPWAFTPKPNTGGTAGTGGSTTKYGISEFMEGGINMTALGLGNECFNTFMAETRASSSPTSTLSDFALGNFGSCGATMSTTPSSTSFVLGGSVTDSATITASSTGGNPPAPTGDVKFYVCGPSAGLTSCDNTGTNFSTVNLSTATVNGNQYTVTSDSFTPTQSGDYCFFASWAGDTNYPNGASFDTSAECFNVLLLQPSMTTAQRFLPNDSATVSVASGAGNLAGSVDFRLFVNNSTCTGTADYESGAIDITTGTGTGLSRTVSTSNTTAYATTGTTFSWLVTYTSTNSGHKNVTATCNAEHSSITIDNGGTFNTP